VAAEVILGLEEAEAVEDLILELEAEVVILRLDEVDLILGFDEVVN
jgi:hypothetical protein